MSEVESIIEKLEERHGSNGGYTPEQIRFWAHMLQMKKYTSYDQPPNKPFFYTSAKPQTSSAATLSPSKRIDKRTELLAQVEKWHSLLEKGVITQNQNQSLQDELLSDIKKL